MAKTIITYLVDGSPTGIKTVELSNWVGKCIIIPRSKLKDSKIRNEVNQPAIYFLFGVDDEANGISYVGEAENLINRIGDHDTNKDFWDVVIAFISKDNNLTKADVKYLEAKALEKAKSSNRYKLVNGVAPIPNNLPEHQISTMNEFLDNIDLLLSAIGYPILKEIISKKEISELQEFYYLNNRGSEAKGIYNEEGFIVLKGSRGAKDIVKSSNNEKSTISKNRKFLIEQGILEISDDSIIFLDDFLFKSPSGASDTLVGRSTNGWIVWKNKDGKTLDEVERKNLK